MYGDDYENYFRNQKEEYDPIEGDINNPRKRI